MNSTFQTKNKTFAGKHEWYTPEYIIKELEYDDHKFMTDPCAAPLHLRPFNIGKINNWTIEDDGLSKKWEGLTFVNPPYGNNTKLWLKKASEYDNCVVLLFARTETKMFFDYVWNKASAVLFFKGRIQFIDSENKTVGNAGAPSVLIAYGENAKRQLRHMEKKGFGKFIEL